MGKQRAKSTAEIVVSKLVQNTYLPLHFLIHTKNPVMDEINRQILAGKEAIEQKRQPQEFTITIAEKDDTGQPYSLDLGFNYTGNIPSVKSFVFTSQGKSHSDSIDGIGSLPTLREVLLKLEKQVQSTPSKGRVVLPDEKKSLGL